MTKTAVGVELQDARLFRQACYVDGAWTEAREGDRSRQPGDRRNHRHRAEVGPRRDRARRSTRPSRAFPAWRRKTAKERAAVMRRWFDLMMANQDDLARLMTIEQGKPLDRIARRGGLRRVVPRMVRRGSQARLRRHDPAPAARQAPDRRQGTDRRRRLHHAVEFSAGDDHPQGRTGDRRRLHGGAQAGVADAVLGARAGGARRARRRAARRVQRHHRIGHRDRRRADVESDRPQALVHRLDRDRQGADGAVRRHGEEAVARARRQRAVHRLRRCGSRRGGRGRDRVEVPQHRPDLRLRQPPARPGQRLRRVRRQAGRGREEAGARRPDSTTAPPRGRSSTIGPSRKWRATSPTPSSKGAQRPGRRQAARARRPLLRADDPDRRDAGDGGRARGNVRPGRAAVPVHDARPRRSRSPTTPSSAWPRTSTAATSAASGASPKRSNTASSASTPGSSRPRSRRLAA